MISKMIKLSLLTVLFLPLALYAEKIPISKFFEFYSETKDFKGITYVNFNPSIGLMKGAAGSAQVESKEVKDIMSHIKSVKILTSKVNPNLKEPKKNSNEKSIDLYGEAIKYLALDEFEKFLEVKEDGTNVKMLYKSSKENMVREFLMLVKENNETSIIWIEGVLNLKDLSKIPGMMGVDKKKSEK